MTSILEALRELEDERRRTRAPGAVSVADTRAEPPRATSLFYPLVAGLAVGVLAVGLGLWWLGAGRGGDVGSALPEAPSPSTGATGAAPGPASLAWLERADAPEARFGRDAPAGAEPVAAPRRRDEAAPPPAPPPATTRSGRTSAVTVESIRYAAAPERRSVTLRLDGRRVTLRQGERAAGVEVQLILEDGAYLNRGTDVVFAAPD